MTKPDLDRELARMLSATRAATEPDPEARARVRASLAMGLVSGGHSQVGRFAGLRAAKPWLLSALAIAGLISVALLAQSGKPLPLPLPAPTRASEAPTPATAEPTPALSPGSTADSEASVGPRATGLAPAPVVSARGFASAEEPSDELGLVSSMQLALRSGNAARALALANEHARRFPSGTLSQEREGARAIARCQLAEPAARASMQSAFEARYPGSPYAARVKAACTR
jgi:hypothetical protein